MTRYFVAAHYRVTGTADTDDDDGAFYAYDDLVSSAWDEAKAVGEPTTGCDIVLERITLEGIVEAETLTAAVQAVETASIDLVTRLPAHRGLSLSKTPYSATVEEETVLDPHKHGRQTENSAIWQPSAGEVPVADAGEPRKDGGTAADG